MPDPSASTDKHDSCTIVLHDDRISRSQVLCGAKILPHGLLATLSAPGARPLTIKAQTQADNPWEISLHMSLAATFNFKHRTKGHVTLIETAEDATATHVELSFRDQYLSRSDMWRMMRTLDDTILFQGQEILFLDARTAKVDKIYLTGTPVDSALVTCARTRPIFRSASARYTILIQLSRAMLEYWKDGDFMYERLLIGYLPALFQRWEHEKVRHQVTVVLFGRAFDAEKATDFFHVVASNVASTQWHEILRALHTAFNGTLLPRQVSVAARGNMVEAIHLAAKDFATEDKDLFLNKTGNSIIAITANAALFETEHDLLRRTTYLLIGNSIGVDIVALSPRPLHPVPLFCYTREGITEYALPHWVDVSYWNGRSTGWAPNWLLPHHYGVIDKVSLRSFAEESPVSLPSQNTAVMKAYDDYIFSTPTVASVINTPPPKVIETHQIGSTETITEKILEKDKDITEIKTIQLNTTAEQPLQETTVKITSLKRPQRSNAAPHSLMQTNRKISVGPKGFAPSWGLASTTVSIEHAGHGKDSTNAVVFAANESASGLARQIRLSLARKPSQQSIKSHSTQEHAASSRPIDIQSNSDAGPDEPDPVDIMEKNVLGVLTEIERTTDSTPTPTPKAREYTLFGPASLAADDESHWTVSPWVTLLNPCNPKRDNMRVASQYRKWQNVFPRAVSPASFKWSSMTTPASLPLTIEYRPSKRVLEKHAAKKLRRILVSSHTGDGHEKTHQLIEQLIALRLTHGFQLPASKMMPNAPLHSDDNDAFLMSLGGVHHELQCLSGSEVQIVEYSPMAAPDKPEDEEVTSAIKYNVDIKAATFKSSVSTTMMLEFSRPELDWTSLDDQVVNHEGPFTDEGVSKIRLVLIPVEFAKQNGTPTSTNRELSDEEKRIDSIQRLTQLWQRNRYLTPEEKQHQASMTRSKATGPVQERDQNPLAIEYQTRDPSAVVNGYPVAFTRELNDMEGLPALFAESDLYHSSTFDVIRLVRHMQDDPPHGVEMRDRRWIAKLHLKCFRGDEMVNWLVRVFKDVNTREEAAEIGNELMRRGIFTHVRHKHDFRDGNYFYQITSSHRTTEYPDTASMFAKGLRSMPSTPAPDVRNSPILRPSIIESHSSGKQTPLIAPIDRKQLLLTHKMQVDMDPNDFSDQLEIANLHYDRIHNPDNCYHIQLDWTNTTTRLIRDAVARWSALVEGHGLKLVQVPLTEASRLPAQHAWEQLICVQLCSPTPRILPSTPLMGPQSPLSPRSHVDPEMYHKAILRKLDFVLDLEAASMFQSKLNVSYSWGRPEYEMTQFVHQSGLLLAQISAGEDADFVFLPNYLAQQPKSFGGAGIRAAESETVESILDKVRAFCEDGEALASFYKDFHNKPRTSIMSPFAPAFGSSVISRPDADVPTFELPPLIHHRNIFKNI